MRCSESDVQAANCVLASGRDLARLLLDGDDPRHDEHDDEVDAERHPVLAVRDR